MHAYENEERGVTAWEDAEASLRGFYQRAHRLLDGLMKGKGASFARAKLLAYIHENAPTRSADIVAAFKIAPRTATMALDAIEREGLVVRERVPGDRRSKYLSLTDKGLATIEAAEPARRAFSERLYGTLTEAEAATLAELIGKLNVELEILSSELGEEPVRSAQHR